MLAEFSLHVHFFFYWLLHASDKLDVEICAIFHQVTITSCPNKMIHLHQVYFNVLSLHMLTIFKFEP